MKEHVEKGDFVSRSIELTFNRSVHNFGILRKCEGDDDEIDDEVAVSDRTAEIPSASCGHR